MESSLTADVRGFANWCFEVEVPNVDETVHTDTDDMQCPTLSEDRLAFSLPPLGQKPEILITIFPCGTSELVENKIESDIYRIRFSPDGHQA